MTAPVRPQGPRRRSRGNKNLSDYLDELSAKPDATRTVDTPGERAPARPKFLHMMEKTTAIARPSITRTKRTKRTAKIKRREKK